MATNEPHRITVPVRRYDVNLSLDDILVPLTRTSAALTQAAHQPASVFAAAAQPEAAQLLQRFTQLVSELREVVDRINQIDPNLLASKPGPRPGG